jgi:uncharacterized protein (TIGR03083 family)
MTNTVSAREVRRSAEYVAGVLSAAAAEPARWDEPAGPVSWSCRETIAHAADCCSWYAALLARRADGDVGVAEMNRAAPPADLLDVLRSAAAVLGAAVTAADPADRGWHPFGLADASGFAGMGADEILVHGADVAAGLGLAYQPPAPLCEAVLRRLFPWAPATVPDPWTALLWANGRASLGAVPPAMNWRWYCAPLDTWDGREPRP